MKTLNLESEYRHYQPYAPTYEKSTPFYQTTFLIEMSKHVGTFDYLTTDMSALQSRLQSMEEQRQHLATLDTELTKQLSNVTPYNGKFNVRSLPYDASYYVALVNERKLAIAKHWQKHINITIDEAYWYINGTTLERTPLLGEQQRKTDEIISGVKSLIGRNEEIQKRFKGMFVDMAYTFNRLDLIQEIIADDFNVVTLLTNLTEE